MLTTFVLFDCLGNNDERFNVAVNVAHISEVRQSKESELRSEVYTLDEAGQTTFYDVLGNFALTGQRINDALAGSAYTYGQAVQRGIRDAMKEEKPDGI